MPVFVPSANDPAVLTSDKFPLLKDGKFTYRTVVKANINGNIDVFSKGTGFFGGDQLLFQYDGTRNIVNFNNGIFKDQPRGTAFNSFFRSTNSNGDQFLDDVKTKLYSEAPPNAAARLAQTSGFRTIAATTPARQTPTGPQSLTIQVQSGAGTTAVTVSPASTPAAPAAPPITTQQISDQLTVSNITPFVGVNVETVNNKLKNTNVVYPNKMPDDQDRIKFTLKEIIGRKFGANDTDFTFGSKNIVDVGGSVVLPIQPSITDSNGVDWGGSTLNPIQAFAARQSLNIQNSNDITAELVRIFTKDAPNAFKSNLTSYKTAINLFLAQEAVGAQGLFSRATGSIVNPNLELLFNGPTLRSFNFTFRLSPRSEPEAVDVKKIIFFFKAAMSVRKSTTDVFLKSPYIFSIQYLSGSSEHKSLNKIKNCALLGCDVDYTPDGSYMTFNDEERTITSYQMTLRFGELDPLYNTDYGEEGNHPIGY